MSDVTDLNDAREARRMGELLSQLDEAVKVEGIDADSTLGRAFAILRHALERNDADRREHRAWLVKFAEEFEERQLRLIEDAREVAETFQATSKDELAKLDRMARKAEADLARKKLEAQDAVRETFEHLAPQLGDKVQEAMVIRIKPLNRREHIRQVAIGVGVVVVLLGGTFGLGRMTAAAGPPVVDPGTSFQQPR